MIRFAAAALLASLLAGTAMAQSVSGTTAAVGNAVSGAASATGKAASSAASSTAAGAKSMTKSAGAMMTGEYADEASAKAHCPADTVVWVNTSSKAIHMAGDKYYGKTKKGAYMCQKDALAGGFHAAKVKTAKPAPAAKSN